MPRPNPTRPDGRSPSVSRLGQPKRMPESRAVRVTPVPEPAHAPRCEIHALGDQSTASRIVRAESILSLRSECVTGEATWRSEVEHTLFCILRLWPSALFIVIAVVCNHTLRQRLITTPDFFQYKAVIAFAIGDLSFAISLIFLWRRVRMSRVQTMLVILMKESISFATLALGIRYGLPWTNDQMSIFFFSIALGLSIMVEMYAAQSLRRERLCSFQTSFLTLSNFLSTIVACFTIMYYAYLVISLDLEDSWLKEWLLNGIAFPVLSVLVGRLLVADLMSFLFMWVFPPESHRAVLTFYTILVRLNFSIASQIAILRLTSTRAFVLSAIAASVMEAAGTLINVKMCDYIRRKAQDYKLDAGRMDKDANVMTQWLAMRSQLAREKLILHTHDEVLGEKVVILAATVETVLTTNNAAQALALRGTILFIAQVLQELLQRAILRWCAEVSLTSNELRYHSWQDNVVLAGIIVMTLNFFTASEDLV